MSHRLLRLLLPFTVCLLLFSFASSLEALRKWEYVNPSDLELKITTDTPEIPAGETATFTITVRNRTNETVKLTFATGQRWDLAAFHEKIQIWRWSNFVRWQEAPHAIPIKPGERETMQLSWTTRDRINCPLPQGIYSVQGMVMVEPRFLVTNETKIRLLPPLDRPRQTNVVKLGSTFEISVPSIIDNQPVGWEVDYDYNDNRISRETGGGDVATMTFRFRANRVGHCTIRMFAHPEFKHQDRSLERRTYRIEVIGKE